MKIFKLVIPVFLAALLAALAACAGGGTEKSTGELIDDAAVTARVKTALIRDDSLDANDINVETYKGTVQLSGFVDDRSDIDEAEELASNVEGVRNVRNDLRYRGDN
ncbi:MAG TPA: BON domain-containing protein [Gammaproteobacteria bacterium]